MAKELGSKPEVALVWSDELPDVLYALSHLLRESRDASATRLTAGKAYDAAASLEWPSQVIDEKSEILASLAYAAWNASRQSSRCGDMRVYAARCEAHVIKQEHARDFLALPPGKRSRVLNSRFLSDPAVLLSAMLKLHRLPNSDPKGAVCYGRELYKWLDQAEAAGTSDETAWFRCQAALATAGGLRHLGEVSEAAEWLELADLAAKGTFCNSDLSLQVEYQTLSHMFSRRQLMGVHERCAKLVRALEAIEFNSELGKARFLHASVLKDEGNEMALAAFEALLTRPEISCDPLLLGLAFLQIGDLRGSRGEFETAKDLFSRALPLIEESKVPWALADFYATVAEKLRDQGRFAEAIEGYRSAIRAYGDQGLSVRESYIRVLLAETLIVDGREGEALGELVAALPVIDRESLEKEGLAAIALLNKVLARSRTAPDALRAVRLQLERLRKGNL